MLDATVLARPLPRRWPRLRGHRWRAEAPHQFRCAVCGVAASDPRLVRLSCRELLWLIPALDLAAEARALALGRHL